MIVMQLILLTLTFLLSAAEWGTVTKSMTGIADVTSLHVNDVTIRSQGIEVAMTGGMGIAGPAVAAADGAAVVDAMPMAGMHMGEGTDMDHRVTGLTCHRP